MTCEYLSLPKMDLARSVRGLFSLVLVSSFLGFWVS
jgi:hypothetical protein